MDSSTIEVRDLATPAELQAAVALQHDTWGERFSDVVPASILKVSQRVGGVSAGAFDANGTLLGFVFGLTGVERGEIVHWSDMLAVRPEARNLGLGRRLKEYQRASVRALGGSVIYWTYDPLVARNAHINFNRLGVRLAEYAENMYGVTDSVLHGGIPTDRMVVAWPTSDAESTRCVHEAERALQSAECMRAPVVSESLIDAADTSSPCLRIEVPADVEQMLRDAPGEAFDWRRRTRRAMQWALRHRYAPRACQLVPGSRSAFYLLTREQSG